MTMRFWTPFALGLLVVTAASFEGQAASIVEEVAKYGGTDRQAFLEAGAKKEGALTLISVGTQIKPVIDRFQEKYPYIRTTLYQVGTSTEIVQKILEEYKVRRYTGDGVEIASASLLALRQAGVLQSYISPEQANYDKAAVEQSGLWTSVRESYGGLGYNTKVIPPAEAPKTWEDLLKPQYKGKMGITNSAPTVGLWVGALVLDLGEGYMRQLGNQDVKVFNLSSRAVANLTVTGEVPISARAADSHFAESKSQGASVEFVDPGAMAVTDTGVGILTNAPRPHAMMLMTDFMLSSEGQGIYKTLGYNSARRDMKGTDAPQKKYYLEQRPTFFEDFDKWVDLFNVVFKTKK